MNEESLRRFIDGETFRDADGNFIDPERVTVLGEQSELESIANQKAREGFDAAIGNALEARAVKYVENFQNPDGTPRADTYAKEIAAYTEEELPEVCYRIGHGAGIHLKQLLDEQPDSGVCFVGTDPYPKIDLQREDRLIRVRAYHDFGVGP